MARGSDLWQTLLSLSLLRFAFAGVFFGTKHLRVLLYRATFRSSAMAFSRSSRTLSVSVGMAITMLGSVMTTDSMNSMKAWRPVNAEGRRLEKWARVFPDTSAATRDTNTVVMDHQPEDTKVIC
jgi:hypothetical protein